MRSIKAYLSLQLPNEAPIFNQIGASFFCIIYDIKLNNIFYAGLNVLNTPPLPWKQLLTRVFICKHKTRQGDLGNIFKTILFKNKKNKSIYCRLIYA